MGKACGMYRKEMYAGFFERTYEGKEITWKTWAHMGGYHQEIGWERMDCIHLTQERDK
jgi:hypothetical protein